VNSDATSRSGKSQGVLKQNRYMSKKRLIEIKEWQEKENARLEAERLQKVREEEEWRNSKHIQ